MRRGFVQGLAGQIERAQGRQVMALQERGILALEHPHRRGRRKQGIDPETLDQAPEDGAVRAHRGALVEDGGLPADQRSIDNVGVAHHPTDVAGAEIRVAGPAIEQIFHR